MIEVLRRRTQLNVAGDVCQRGALSGLYDDGWTNGALQFVVEGARPLTSVSVTGLVPDWWPPGSVICLDIDGRSVAQTDALPGAFSLESALHVPRGRPASCCLKTSSTVHDDALDRELGVYASAFHFGSSGAAPFVCNVCESRVDDLDPVLDPEGSLCPRCGSNIRLRGLAHLIGMVLYGKTLAVPRFPAIDVAGVGISDSPQLARRLARAIRGYVNTQFDPALVNRKTPFLDVQNPPGGMIGTADFVTCSEVLEHVEPPVQRSFDGLYALLKPGGTLILTVPHTLGDTVEHFPDLYEWRIEERPTGRVVVNRTRAGAVQEFDTLSFHGGGDAVLEMRVFGLQDIFAKLQTAGFTNIRVREENVLQHGIFFKYSWGLPITAERPR